MRDAVWGVITSFVAPTVSLIAMSARAMTSMAPRSTVPASFISSSWAAPPSAPDTKEESASQEKREDHPSPRSVGSTASAAYRRWPGWLRQWSWIRARQNRITLHTDEAELVGGARAVGALVELHELDEVAQRHRRAQDGRPVHTQGWPEAEF